LKVKTRMKEFRIQWDNKTYQLVGYSVIEFPVDFKDYRETIDQMLSNAEFYGEKYGITYLDLYDEIGEFIRKYSRTYVPFNSEYIFKSGVFIKGTFIYKLVETLLKTETPATYHDIKVGMFIKSKKWIDTSEMCHPDGYWEDTFSEIIKLEWTETIDESYLKIYPKKSTMVKLKETDFDKSLFEN